MPTPLFHLRDIDTDLLQRERARALALVQHALPTASIAEVGSTAVPGVLGKQDLDFVAKVPAPRFDAARTALDAAFARNPDQISTPEYQGYTIESPLDIAIQLIIAGGPHDNFDRFAQALRANPDLRTAYNSLKAAWHGRPMGEYRAAKAAFIQSVLRKPT